MRINLSLGLRATEGAGLSLSTVRRRDKKAHQRARDVLTTQADELRERFKRLNPDNDSPFYLGPARELIEARILLWKKQQKRLEDFLINSSKSA